jgi:uncharacterized protein
MKAVIDTNVFVSGIFWKGTPARILEAWGKQRFSLVLSPAIFSEYQRVLEELSRKSKSVDTAKILDLVSYHAELVPDLVFAKPVCTDPDDDKFLAAALSARASFIVTGDKALLKVAEFHGAKVVTPRTFLDALK